MNLKLIKCYLNLCGGYDKHKTHIVIFMLSILYELEMICY
jgi:hypothetical protein